MRSFCKPAGIVTMAAVFVGALGVRSPALGGQPLSDSKSTDAPPAASEQGNPGAAKDKKSTPGGAEKGERMHDIPVAKDHPAKGLKIPYFDNDGKLQMTFVIGVATRVDADHINMSDMQVQTYDEQGKPEMSIDLPTSVLDLNTSVISTEKRAVIRREDFVLTGETMEFNTKTKQGTLGGAVRMVVYNLDTPPPPAGSDNRKPPPATPGPKKEKAPTVITSKRAMFDRKANLAVFTDDVLVKDPEFNVVCDKMTAYLKHDEPVKAGKGGKLALSPATPAPAEAAPGDPNPAKKSGSLERAVAEMNPGGRVEITQDKKEADGTITHSIGHGAKADYDTKTGDIQLFGRPDVKKGSDWVIATDDATAITLNRDGHMTTNGPSKTFIVNKDESGKKEKPPTEISSGESMLDQKKHIAIFSTDVVVKDPEFNVICDKLTAFLKHDEPAKTGEKGAPATPVAASPHPLGSKPGDQDASKKSSGGLERAIAEMTTADRRVEITQDKTETDGTVSHAIGHGSKADYDANTGDIKLFGQPDVVKGTDSVVSTDDSTVITMNRDGHMSTKGPSKTVIVNKDESGKKDKEPTEITSGESTLDQKANIAIFYNNVIVKDPEFNVVCDKLTAYLKHGESGKSTKATPRLVRPVDARPGDLDPPKKSGGGLERAVAEMNPGGRVQIAQDRKEADGTISHATGNGTRADYNAMNGDIKLFGRPEGKKGTDLLLATEDRTVITLNRDGRMHADGPSKTVIISKEEIEAK